MAGTLLVVPIPAPQRIVDDAPADRFGWSVVHSAGVARRHRHAFALAGRDGAVPALYRVLPRHIAAGANVLAVLRAADHRDRSLADGLRRLQPGALLRRL